MYVTALSTCSLMRDSFLWAYLCPVPSFQLSGHLNARAFTLGTSILPCPLCLGHPVWLAFSSPLEGQSWNSVCHEHSMNAQGNWDQKGMEGKEGEGKGKEEGRKGRGNNRGRREKEIVRAGRKRRNPLSAIDIWWIPQELVQNRASRHFELDGWMDGWMDGYD